MTVSASPGSQSSSCPRKSLPFTEVTPLPHLAGITYFRSPCKRSCSSPQTRPVPPTPCKMMASTESSLVPTPLTRQRRPSSVSAIPRPTSGTSRRATPLETNNARTTPIEAETTVRSIQQTRRRSGLPVSHPPSSFSAQRAKLPRPESLLPYSQRPTSRDLSGVRQQLHIRNYSTQSLANLDALSPKGISTTSLPLSPRMGLPKSKTSTSLAQRVRDLTPQRQLMQPLGPPLLRTQTIGNLSCFTGAGVDSTPSPVKSPLRGDDGTWIKNGPGAELDVVDALLESRMTDGEITMLKQVKKEAKVNQQRLRNTSDGYSSPRLAPVQSLSSSTSFTRLPGFATLNLSANDVANTKRLEEQRYRLANTYRANRRHLFINSTLANSIGLGSAMPTPASATSDVSVPDDEWEVNLKHVHFPESIPYWTGRYMALSDRLRTNDAPPISSNFTADASYDTDPDPEEPYHLAEWRRHRLVLGELRLCCRTEKALKSFERFEMQLKKNTDKKSETFGNSGKETVSQEAYLKHSAVNRAKLLSGPQKSKNAWWLGYGSGSGSAVSRVTSNGTLNSAKSAGDGKKNDFKRPGLSKSMTTGNLATVDRRPGAIYVEAAQKTSDPPTASSADRVWATASSRKEAEHAWNNPNADFSSNLKMLREREERAQRRAEQVRRRGSEKPAAAAEKLVGSKHSEEDSEKENEDQEKDALVMTKLRTRSGRQSSGDVLKIWMDSGIKGVRRMGRRVTGGGLDEDALM